MTGALTCAWVFATVTPVNTEVCVSDSEDLLCDNLLCMVAVVAPANTGICVGNSQMLFLLACLQWWLLPTETLAWVTARTMRNSSGSRTRQTVSMTVPLVQLQPLGRVRLWLEQRATVQGGLTNWLQWALP